MENQKIMDGLQKILIKTDSLSYMIKMQNDQISEILQRQQLFDKVLNRLENKIDRNLQNTLQNNNSSNFPHSEYDSQCHSKEKGQVKNKLQRVTLHTSQSASRLIHSPSEEIEKGRRKLFSVTRELLGCKISLKVHERNSCLNEFTFEKDKIRACSNGWYQLLMKKELQMEKRQYFEIRLGKSLKKYLMIGIMSLQRLKCSSSFESGKGIALYLWNNHIYSKFGKEKRVITNQVKQGDLIKVLVEGDEIKWFTNNCLLGSSYIVPELKLCKLVPYVQMYNSGDQIELR